MPVALIEHRRVIPLGGAVEPGGGFPLANTWPRPDELLAVDALLADGALRAD
ncbi:MAG TPA: hypothetical protein VNC79_07235 [Mycobacteriales bacterium]|nr:hypothetical protein [Mycobacteriales bacterium]